MLDPIEELHFHDRNARLEKRPVGVCALITPFNFPLNLVAHKVAPALATGCPFILKPAEKTPLTALALCELLEQCEPPLPPDSFAVCVALPKDCGPLSLDSSVRHLSFTGSPTVGWQLKSLAQRAHVTLELGGNAASIVCDDWPLEHALKSCCTAAFAYSGQVCISLQRLFLPSDSFQTGIHQLAQLAQQLKRGPLNEAQTDIGPMIDLAAAKRVEQWVNEALADGATLHCGGSRNGTFFEPTVLSGVSHNTKIWQEEVFGPVVCVEAWSDFPEALAAVNDSRWGLQTSVYTHDRSLMEQAWQELEVGQVIIGDATTFRVDEMPYGGVKDSGVGREGLRWAINAMTEPRLLVLPPSNAAERS